LVSKLEQLQLISGNEAGVEVKHPQSSNESVLYRVES
jgi:hypothetical protein